MTAEEAGQDPEPITLHIIEARIAALDRFNADLTRDARAKHPDLGLSALAWYLSRDDARTLLRNLKERSEIEKWPK
jgi:hypothetical protein